MKEKQYIEIALNNANIIKYEVLLSFIFNNKNYIVYTDNSYHDKNELNIFAAIFNSNNNCLEKIETEEEWNIVDSKVKELQNNNS